MNQLEDTFMEVALEWEILMRDALVRPLEPVDLLPCNKALNAHAAALVAMKRDQVKKLRTPAAGADVKLHQAR